MEHERYTRKTFRLACIASHITKNKQNIVIAELRPLPGVAVMLTPTAGYVPYLSQPLYLTQPSQNMDDGDGPVPMGYGIV
jgi:hypothetical protein